MCLSSSSGSIAPIDCRHYLPLVDKDCLRCFEPFEGHRPVGARLACPDGRGSYAEPHPHGEDAVLSFAELELEPGNEPIERPRAA